MKVKSESEVAKSDPMNCSLPGSSIHGIFQARVLEWGAMAFSSCKASISQMSQDKTPGNSLVVQELKLKSFTAVGPGFSLWLGN